MAESITQIARRRFEYAKGIYGTSRQQSVEDTQFVMGDSDNRYQWDQAVYDDRNNARKPCLTINITAQHCNQIENQIRQNRPSAKVVPVDSDADTKTANLIGGMLRSIQAYSNADTAHDIAAQHSIYGGEGYWRVLTDYETETSFDQTIFIRALTNPQLVFIDPDAIEPDRSDARWGMIFEDIPRKDAEDEYKEQFLSWGNDGDWCNKDTVRRAEYFYRVDDEDTLYLLSSGETILRSELPEGAKVNIKKKIGSIVTEDAVWLVIDERPTTIKKWKWCRIVGDSNEPEDEKDWPGSYLPIITVVGKEVNVNGQVIRKGLVRDMKDQQRMLNYSYSTAVEQLALQPKAPYKAAAEAIEGYEDVWAKANTGNNSYLPYNAFDDQGNPLPMPEREAPPQLAAAQIQMMQVATEQARAATGQQNANFGIRSEAQSGVGIQRLKAQGEIATFHFPDNLARALKYEATVILDLIPKIYDRKRIVRILGLDGEETAAMLDPDYQGEAQEVDQQSGIDQIFNPLVGRYDVHIDTGPSYQTQRQEAAAALTELSSRAPVLMNAAPDLVIKAFDFPMREEIAARLKRTVPQQIIGDEKNPEGQLQAQLQQLMQQMQQMQQAGQQLVQQRDELAQQLQTAELKEQGKVIQEQAENERAQLQYQIDAYEAETRRLAALQQPAQALDPLALQAVIREQLFSILQEPAPEQFIPPEMAATGAYPGPSQDVLIEGNPNV